MMPHGRSHFGMSVLFVVLLAGLVVACTTAQWPGSKRPLPGTPSDTTAASEEVLAEGAPPPMDPAVVEKAISGRKEQLALAREKYARFRPGADRDALGSLIHSLSAQISYLEQVKDQLQSWPSEASRAEQARLTQRMTEKLMACIASSPLEVLQDASPSRVRENDIDWDAMRAAYDRGRCEEAIELSGASGEMISEVEIPADIQVRRALCLSRLGKYEEAIGMLEPMLQNRTLLLDAQYLNYMVANWLFEQSLLDRARKAYQFVLDGEKERDRWAELARLRIGQIRLQRGELLEPEKEGPLVTGESEPVGPSHRNSAEKIKTGETTKSARATTEKAPTWEPKVETISPSEDEAPPSIHELRDARLQEAQQFMDNEQYEEAVVAYEPLLGTEYDTMAQEGIQRAQDGFAEKQRKEAASLVLKARSKSEIASRKDLLLQALRLLQDINARYPSNRYAAKVQQNIRDLVEQIQEMDPGFDPYSTRNYLSGEAATKGTSPR